MKFERHVLQNGLRLVIVPMKDNPTATVMVMVEAGSKYETKDVSGISHFLEHLCFKGTVKRPSSLAISLSMDKIGASYNAFTNREYTGYYAKSSHEHLSHTFDVISDIYLNSTIPEKEVEKERGVIIEEIRMYNDEPQEVLADKFTELLYGDQPAGWLITGTEESVRGITRQNVLDYRARMYVPEATVVVVAGNVVPSEVLKMTEAVFGALPARPKTAKLPVIQNQTAPAVVTIEKKLDQTHLVIGVRADDMYSKRNVSLRVLRAVLSGGMSSRLFQKLREELGVCYYARAEYHRLTDQGVFIVSAGVDPKRVSEALKAIMSELSRLIHEQVSDEELAKVKDWIVAKMYLGNETSDDFADFVAFREIFGFPIKTLKDVEEEIRAVTAEQVQEAARTIFKTEHLNLGITGQGLNEEEFKKLLAFS